MHAEPAGEGLARLDNARFNLHLRCDAIEIAQEPLDLANVVGNVLDDEAVRPEVHFDFAAGAEIALHDVQAFAGIRVIEIHDPGG